VGKKVVIPLCGGNIDITMLGRVIERGLAADRRLVKMWITVSFARPDEFSVPMAGGKWQLGMHS